MARGRKSARPSWRINLRPAVPLLNRKNKDRLRDATESGLKRVMTETEAKRWFSAFQAARAEYAIARQVKEGPTRSFIEKALSRLQRDLEQFNRTLCNLDDATASLLINWDAPYRNTLNGGVSLGQKIRAALTQLDQLIVSAEASATCVTKKNYPPERPILDRLLCFMPDALDPSWTPLRGFFELLAADFTEIFSVEPKCNWYEQKLRYTGNFASFAAVAAAILNDKDAIYGAGPGKIARDSIQAYRAAMKEIAALNAGQN